MTIFYFTATGNSLAVAKRVGGELISIPKALKDGESGYEDDVIGFVFPDFDGSLPRIMITDRVAFGDERYSCFACLHACPKNAIHVKGERSSKRWRNPDVTLKELIDANQQVKR